MESQPVREPGWIERCKELQSGAISLDPPDAVRSGNEACQRCIQILTRGVERQPHQESARGGRGEDGKRAHRSARRDLYNRGGRGKGRVQISCAVYRKPLRQLTG